MKFSPAAFPVTMEAAFLTLRYCEKQMKEMQANSGGYAILAPAPIGEIQPVSCIENLGEIRALPAPFPVPPKEI
jgi:hypothetical protein